MTLTIKKEHRIDVSPELEDYIEGVVSKLNHLRTVRMRDVREWNTYHPLNSEIDALIDEHGDFYLRG